MREELTHLIRLEYVFKEACNVDSRFLPAGRNSLGVDDLGK